jgi:predicted aminopeptidase
MSADLARAVPDPARAPGERPRPSACLSAASCHDDGVAPLLRRLFALAGLLALLLGLTGCFSARYLWQAAGGELDILNRARPIELAVLDDTTSPRIRALLGEVGTIKRFGEAQGLKPTDNYQDYSDLHRPAAVWVVSACEPLRFRSLEWSFPIVGRVPYLGWFDRNEARDFARELKAAGWDVDLRGADAFSTLGWFDDPVLSTMIPDGDEAVGDLANVVLHESVHATVFLKGQADLNESLADFVADRLTPLYLTKTRGPGSREAEAYAESERASAERGKKLHAAYQALERLYSSARPAGEKRVEKAKIIDELSASIGARRPITNATLAQFRTYHGTAPELEQLLDACGGSIPRFLGALRGVDHRANAKAAIVGLARARCPAPRG